MLEAPLKPMDFAVVVSDKKLKGSGLVRGDEVLIMGSEDSPFTKKDIYLKRTYVVVAKVVDDLAQIPKAGSDVLAVKMDPRNLELVSDERKEQLLERAKEHYST